MPIDLKRTERRENIKHPFSLLKLTRKHQMLVNIDTESKAIDLIISEAIGIKPNEGLGIDQWVKVFEICAYLRIPHSYLVMNINEKVALFQNGFRGLSLLSFDARKQHLEFLDKHLGSTHLADLNALLDRIEKRFEREINEKN
jgi:hypothetical protein